MKKWIVLAMALLIFTVLPSPGMELGELHPISMLSVGVDGKSIYLVTDTLDSGTGETLEAALRNMKATTPGHLFLDTVENLVITEQTRYLIPQLKSILRPGVLVCLADSEVNPETVPEFLRSHIPEYRLSETDENTPLQKLVYSEERYILER